jgi:endonuclease-3
MENEASGLIIKIIKKLSKKYPNVTTDLTHKSPFELLIATMLSAQCTDKRVNMVTPELFTKYPNPSALALATLEDVEKIIYSTGFYKNKAKNIVNCANELITKYSGEVPSKMEELVGLSGVGRKTANCVMGYYFEAEGIVVDTHVIRITNLLGIVKTKDAEKIEKELMVIIPKKYWVNFTHYLIKYGRETCIARHPKCSECEINKYCRAFIN